MLPFALKVVWFVLSFVGTIACWVVHYLLSRAIGSYWGPGLYNVFATLLQGIFCLGMIHEMDPFRMPRAFCLVQTFVIYYSAWSLTGVSAAFTFATSSLVLWPLSTKRSDACSTLAWKNKYYFPILVFPLACLSVSLPLLLRANAIRPTDDLHCDATHPEWGRFLGYAGFPMIPTIPCLFLSAVAARRVFQLHRANRHSHFSFKYSKDPLHFGSQLGHEQDGSSGRPGGMIVSRGNTTPACVDTETIQPTQDVALCGDPNVSPSSRFGMLSLSRERSEVWEALGANEEADELDPRREIRCMMLSSMTHITPPPRPNLAPAIWRLILFQIAFFITQCLAALSTVIDVARHRPTPTPFGSQHVALVLTVWGPAVFFGQLPVIRRQLMFWRK